MTTATAAAPAASFLSTTALAIARHLPRLLLGLCFFVSGLDGFLHFFPQPTSPLPAGAVAFGGALLQTGYMFPLIKGTEVLAGALFLANRFVALGLVLLAPVLVNIFAFHAFLAPDGLGLVVLLLALAGVIAFQERRAWLPLLRPRA
jgi:hypothetical protein